MSVHIIPHGRVTAHIKRGLRWHDSVDAVHLLVSPRYMETSQELADDLREFGYTTEVHEISAFKLRSVVDTIVSISRNDPTQDYFINITGGTNLMAGAATSSAFFIGATPYYVLEPQEDEPICELVITLPIPNQPLIFDLGDAQRKVLEQIWMWEKKGKTGIIGREIGDALGESAQSISYHVTELDRRGLVETFTEGRRKEITLTDAGRLYLQWTMGTKETDSLS